MKQTLILIILLTIATTTSSIAQEVIIPVNHYPPWKIIDKQNHISGINIEITNLLLSRIGLKGTYIKRPWKRCQLMMKQGNADIMSGLLKHPAREKHMFFLDPPYKTKSSKAFYVLKGRAHSIKSYDDLDSLNIGITLGTKFFPQFDNDTKLHKDIAKDATTNFLKLIAGRTDTFILTETVGDYLMYKHGFQDRVEKADYSYSLPLPVYFAVSKKSPLAKRVPELNAALKEMVESGEVQKTIDRFLTNLN